VSCPGLLDIVCNHSYSHVRFLLTCLEAAQAYSSVQRITRFLEREVRAAGDGPNGDSAPSLGNAPLIMENATFYTGSAKAPSFHVSTFNVSVGKGEVLAVCGPVGGESNRSGLQCSCCAQTIVSRSRDIISYGVSTACVSMSLRREVISDKWNYKRIVRNCRICRKDRRNGIFG
jgi:hypothetical protein